MIWDDDGTAVTPAAALVTPESVEEVAAVARACDDARVPLTVAAGRSGVCGASMPVHGGVVLDLTALDGIVAVDDTSLVLDVRAGTFGTPLEAALRTEHGVTLGHWPQSIDLSTVGGWLACRAWASSPPATARSRTSCSVSTSSSPTAAPSTPAARRAGGRTRPHAGVRGERGHTRDHHRRPTARASRTHRRGARRVPLRHVRRRPRRVPAHPAAWRDTCGAAPLRRHRSRPSLRRCRRDRRRRCRRDRRRECRRERLRDRRCHHSPRARRRRPGAARRRAAGGARRVRERDRRRRRHARHLARASQRRLRAAPLHRAGGGRRHDGGGGALVEAARRVRRGAHRPARVRRPGGGVRPPLPCVLRRRLSLLHLRWLPAERPA